MAEVLGTYVLGTDEIPVLEIGVQSENQAVEIKFDYTAWHELYGDGDIGIMLLRKGDEQAFPAKARHAGNFGKIEAVKLPSEGHEKRAEDKRPGAVIHLVAKTAGGKQQEGNQGPQGEQAVGNIEIRPRSVRHEGDI